MYAAYIMKRTQIYLDEEQDRRLRRRAEIEGSTKSRLIRRAVDVYLAERDVDKSELERFREAARDTAGIAPYLPDGTAYVEAMRSLDAQRVAELERRWRA
jgi:predicted transcriptional regulator